MWGRGAHRKCMGRWDNNAAATAQAIHFFLIGALCHQRERIAAVGLSRKNHLVKQCGTVWRTRTVVYLLFHTLLIWYRNVKTAHTVNLHLRKLSARKMINITHFCCFTWRYPEAQKGGRWKLSLHKWGGLMTHHVRWCFPNLISRQPPFNERAHGNVNTSL